MFYFLKEYLKAIIKILTGRGVRKSYSQFGEDVFAQSFLRGEKGIYCDVGAYHPVLYSNTYALYKKGWKGVVIEPNNDFYLSYKLLRPRDVFVNAGVGEEREGFYYIFSDGAYNTFDTEEAEKAKAVKGVDFLGTKKVVIRPLHYILKENNIKELEFLNIDTEGGDLEVLESYDWRVRPKVIAVEDRDFNPEEVDDSKIYRFLKLKDYQLKGFGGLTLIWKDGKYKD